MQHINKTQIPQKIRQKNISRYKTQIKQALGNPTLSKEQRIELRRKLKVIGKRRNYQTEKPLDGAIEN